MSLREIFARNLKRERRAQNLTQEELAERSDINRNSIGMLERQEYTATIDMLEKVAAGLGIDPRELLDPDKPEAT